MTAQITYEELMEDAAMLFDRLGRTPNRDARIVDRMRRVIAAYALTSNLSTECVIKISEDVKL